jgi:GPH family glycoside/pentoside/hexuronide:cation symporter
LPEITSDYVERTTLFRYRYLFGWLGGLFMMVLAYSVFLSGEGGLLNVDGYANFGIFGGILMAVSVFFSAFGQHKLVAHLPPVKPAPFSFKECFKEIKEAFSEKAFLIFAAGGLAAYVSQGMSFSLSNYLNVFVWRLDSTAVPVGSSSVTALDLYPFALFLSVVLMFFIVGPLHNNFGKPKSAVIGAIGGIVILLSPYGLLLLGLWPEPSTLLSAALLYAVLIPGNALAVVVMVSASSMIAEIVEAYQERTSLRAEGAFYSGNWLVQKCATGFGIFLSGQILALAQLSPSADPAQVPQSVISDIVIYFGSATIVLTLIAAFWLGRFPISREEHEARIARQTANADPAADSSP